MDLMRISLTIKEKQNGDMGIYIKIDGNCSASGLVHCIASFLNAIEDNTNLAIVTLGIEDFINNKERDNEE